MFTGIVEYTTEVLNIKKDRNNLHITFQNVFNEPIKIDQSIAHNGICLTVVKASSDKYTVTVIKETIYKTNIATLKIGNKVNVERCIRVGGRLDGHIVQGHIDQTAKCIDIQNQEGSWLFTFEYQNSHHITIEKGSIAINGVSLTIVNSQSNKFSVAIIPYTLNHTNFKDLALGTLVNIEFDIIGKYISRLFKTLPNL